MQTSDSYIEAVSEMTIDTDYEAGEGEMAIPFLPFVLKYTITDLSSSVPVYTSDINLTDVRQEINTLNTYIADGCLYLYSQKDDSGNDKPRLLPFSADGTVGEAIAVPCYNGITPVYAYHCSDGTFAVICEEMTETNGMPDCRLHVAVLQSDGTVIAEVEVREYFAEEDDFAYNYQCKIFAAQESALSVLVGTPSSCVQICYDTETQNLDVDRRVKHDSSYTFYVRDAYYLGDSRYFTQTDEDRAGILDMASGTWKSHGLRIAAENKGAGILLDGNGRYYLIDSEGIWRYNDNYAPTKILDHMECGTEQSTVILLDENRGYSIENQVLNQKAVRTLQHIYMEKEPDTASQAVIRFDYYGSVKDDEWFTEAVRGFNALNTPYRVEIREINMASMKLDEVETLFAENMLGNDHPDMLLMSRNTLSLDMYYEKNIFVDLADVFGDSLLGCIREGMVYGDALYAIPMNMWLSTFVCTDETWDGYLTWEAFFDIIDGLGADTVLTSDSRVQKHLYNNGILDFFDKGKKTADYDSETFCRMVEYTENLDAVIDKEVGYFDIDSYNRYGYTNVTLPARVRDGGIKLLHADISSPMRLHELNAFFGEMGFNWCGYPSRDGGSAYIVPRSRICILSDSTVQEG